MKNYVYGITAAEIMSILVCVVLLCYSIFKKKDKTRRDRLFVLLLASCVAALDADALKDAIVAQQNIASFGCTFGNGSKALELISTAEKAMYADKKAYYERSGMDRQKI